jgi:hypothetical protein
MSSRTPIEHTPDDPGPKIGHATKKRKVSPRRCDVILDARQVARLSQTEGQR